MWDMWGLRQYGYVDDVGGGPYVSGIHQAREDHSCIEHVGYVGYPCGLAGMWDMLGVLPGSYSGLT